MNKVIFFWFRRDLRLKDNNALYQALSNDKKLKVIPLFIFDKNILDKLKDKNDKRVNFIYEQLKKINKELEKYNSSLLIKYGYPKEIWQELINNFEIQSVYLNHDYEPYSIQRDSEIKKILNQKGIEFFSYKDQVIFEKQEILNNENKPYTIYTYYKNKWLDLFTNKIIEKFETEKYFDYFYNEKFNFPDIKQIGFNRVKVNYPELEINKEIISNYDKNRDIPYLDKTSHLGIHLRFGTISIRSLVKEAFKLNKVFLNELIWREFFMQILYNFPYVVEKSFKKEYENLKWESNQENFLRWCNGETGYPIVDAGMRQLNQTGYMHNRVRMITASFLVKHLLIDWRLGEKYFAEKLLDYELASNNGNWQWCASIGCDSVPYFRIFNPNLQTKKFDPNLEYIKKWLPEINTFSYPKPIINHDFARKRVLEFYKLKKNLKKINCL
ncbi:MAG: deoxyribodipyrimidine photo-lyase [Candidatus Sericytochromatia bacterium]|nr:MAG: deoxyribodipyrimidine photo-lyase [Candidatus Sericytochromatia bacterium]